MLGPALPAGPAVPSTTTARLTRAHQRAGPDRVGLAQDSEKFRRPPRQPPHPCSTRLRSITAVPAGCPERAELEHSRRQRRRCAVGRRKGSRRRRSSAASLRGASTCVDLTMTAVPGSGRSSVARLGIAEARGDWDLAAGAHDQQASERDLYPLLLPAGSSRAGPTGDVAAPGAKPSRPRARVASSQ
jgi:hypothetical protein